MTFDESATWIDNSVHPGHTAPNARREEQVLTSPFLTANITPSNTYTPYQPSTADASHHRDPDINAEVQDYTRELSPLLNRMPNDILTPMMAGLRVQPTTSAPSVPTFDLLGMTSPDASRGTSSIHSGSSILPVHVQSINPFDAIPSMQVPEMMSKNYQHHSSIPFDPSLDHQSSSSHGAPSLTHTDTSDASCLTIPELSNRIHITPTQPRDRYTFDPGLLTPKFPVKVFFIKRFVHHRSPGRNGSIFRWHLRLEEAFPRAFARWQIALSPGEYLFEDFGNSLVILGQKHGTEPILFTFPVASNTAWPLQGIHRNGRARPLEYSDLLTPCYLHCTLSRGPRLGGFLHPSCYGIPGEHASVNKKSHQNYYVPTSVFQNDGLIITESYATAFFRGCAASGVGNPLKAFHTLTEAKAHLRRCAPQTVSLPALVPYISSQLEQFDLLDDGDGAPSPLDPITVAGQIRGRQTPMLYPATGDFQTQSPWDPTPRYSPLVSVPSSHSTSPPLACAQHRLRDSRYSHHRIRHIIFFSHR